MTVTGTAQHLATIDLLRSLPFPEASQLPAGCGQSQHRGVYVASGPGYHLAELAASGEFWEDDGTARLAAEEEYEADCRALSLALAARSGEPQPVSLWSTLVRSAEGEEVAQPWLE